MVLQQLKKPLYIDDETMKEVMSNNFIKSHILEMQKHVDSNQDLTDKSQYQVINLGDQYYMKIDGDLYSITSSFIQNDKNYKDFNPFFSILKSAYLFLDIKDNPDEYYKIKSKYSNIDKVTMYYLDMFIKLYFLEKFRGE